jgi:hypothetical protein
MANIDSQNAHGHQIKGGGCYHRSWIFCDGNNIFNLNSRFKMDAEYLCIIILSVGCVISVNSIFCVISVG